MPAPHNLEDMLPAVDILAGLEAHTTAVTDTQAEDIHRAAVVGNLLAAGAATGPGA